jgi:hypothetical protein
MGDLAGILSTGHGMMDMQVVRAETTIRPRTVLYADPMHRNRCFRYVMGGCDCAIA